MPRPVGTTLTGVIAFFTPSEGLHPTALFRGYIHHPNSRKVCSHNIRSNHNIHKMDNHNMGRALHYNKEQGHILRIPSLEGARLPKLVSSSDQSVPSSLPILSWSTGS
jgi:hypothetical protein